ncbi:hypothetical protein [Amycolatopsis sp. NPDC051716]|uniref:hypothetical protein n=1 Tax=Amycolatopsis sp. NPDC051716 TaxID=3155804 RepID=UPI003439E511
MAHETENRVSLSDLHAAFDAEFICNKRAAAETAYALAFRYRDNDIDGKRRFDAASEWAKRAIALLDELPSDSVGDVASERISVGGIPIPALLHADVVSERLCDVLH